MSETHYLHSANRSDWCFKRKMLYQASEEVRRQGRNNEDVSAMVAVLGEAARDLAVDDDLWVDGETTSEAMVRVCLDNVPERKIAVEDHLLRFFLHLGVEVGKVSEPEECLTCPVEREKFVNGCYVYIEYFPRWGREELRKEGKCPGRWYAEENKD